MTRLRGYLDHGILELDNNTAERSMRAIALGRKNYLFMGSERGGKSAAIAYTLIETAKLNGVDPQPWLLAPDRKRRLGKGRLMSTACPGFPDEGPRFKPLRSRRSGSP